MASKATFNSMKKTPKFSSRKQVRCEITGRLCDAIAAGNTQIDIPHAEPETTTRIEYSQQHREARAVPPHDGAARVSGGLGASQGLHFGEDRARSLHRREHGAA